MVTICTAATAAGIYNSSNPKQESIGIPY
eukprot:SAG22_NODE_6705_length_821_cov_1.698061_1_plen_28_part_01